MSYTHDPDDITPEMTSDTTPSPNVASVSSYYADYLAWKCFDHIPSPIPNNSLWLTFISGNPLPQWLQFDFGGPVVVNRYKLTNIGAAAGVGDLNNPRDWLFQGKNDGGWDTLDSQADITWVVDETKEFPFSNTTSYSVYRVYITDYNPAPYPFLAIAELELFGPPPPTYTLAADAGTYSKTGQATSLRAARKLTTAPDSYALTGQLASLKAIRKIPAAPGSYLLSGQLASLKAARRIAAEEGLYALTGQDADLTTAHHYKLMAEAGSYGETYSKIFLTLDGRIYKKMGNVYLRLQ